jgi:hypothetical protein
MFGRLIRAAFVALQVAAAGLLVTAVQLGGLLAVFEVLIIIATEVVLSLSNLVLLRFKSGLDGDRFAREGDEGRRRKAVANGREITAGKEPTAGRMNSGGKEPPFSGNELPENKEGIRSENSKVKRRRQCCIGSFEVLDDL